LPVATLFWLARHLILGLVRPIDIATVATVSEPIDGRETAMKRRTLMVQTSMKRLALGLAAGVGAAVLVSGTFLLVAPRQAQATPAYAQQTGKACGYCPVSASGGGPLKAAGKKFQKNGHKL
jgi:hypothetical protein